MPVVRSLLSFRTASLVACGFIIAHIAFAQPSPTSPSPQTPTANELSPARPQPADQPPPADRLGEIKLRLEIDKLREDITNIKNDITNDTKALERQKLKAEREKLEADTSKANFDKLWGWIAPLVSILSIVILVATLRNQRSTALDVQDRQATSALKLQKEQAASALALQERQGNQALQLKITELIMASRSPALAGMRAELLSTLYDKSGTSAFLSKVKEMTDDKKFPGDLGHELRTKVFEELAEKYENPADVKLAAETIYCGDDWLKEDIAPPTTFLPRPPDSPTNSVV